MKRQTNFTLEDVDDVRILLRDVGPHDRYKTITNAPEEVVAQLAPVLAGRELHYIDTDGQVDRLLVEEGKFAGFAHVAAGPS